ncbi:MAG: ATP-binding cassette domain-containing protein [Xanthomonadales bacterium]|nr:ATP-binding cassette domain-containing protein [Xanthomonadales bacterium]
MTQLIQLKGLGLSYGAAPLLDNVDLSINAGERVCLVGRNGAGKSTLLKVLDGQVQVDDGEIIRATGLRIARLAQEVPQGQEGSVFEVVASGLGEAGAEAQRYHELSLRLAHSGSNEDLNELEACQQRLEAMGGWDIQQRVERVLSRLELDGSLAVASLSGGMKRRVLLAQALVIDPQLLLLDEPTNHLDIEAIQWLEEELVAWPGALLFITHDRAFLRRLATRIIELDRGHLTDWPGDYDNYQRRKQEHLDAEEKHNALFDKRLAAEEVWIRQGIKARRTRNEGRVRALKAMRQERAQRRERQGDATMSISQAGRSGKVVARAEGVRFDYDGKTIIRDLETTIMRGDKVGVIGPNGAGKTTLLKLLLGDLEAASGKIQLGTQLEVAYFDQHRAVLDENKSVQDNVAGGQDMLTIDGQPRHVISYLQDFLFAPERVRQPVKALSGGERNRLLLARMFTKPSNLLVLDEPTNDLDVETLDLLASLLVEYQGTVLLVSHDRDFIDEVVTSTLVFEGQGNVREYVGGYSDWLRQCPQNMTKKASGKKTSTASSAEKTSASTSAPAKSKKLTYKDQRELNALPAKIESLEARQETLHAQMSDPDFYRKSQEEIATFHEELAQVEADLNHAYERWEVLEG